MFGDSGYGELKFGKLKFGEMKRNLVTHVTSDVYVNVNGDAFCDAKTNFTMHFNEKHTIKKSN